MFKGKDGYSNLIATITLGISVVAIYATLVAHASATNFKAGYLEHFEIDIRNIDYWPTIADFINDPLLAILAILASLGLYLLACIFINGIHWLLQIAARRKRWKMMLDFIDEKPFGKWTLIWSSIVLSLILSFNIALYGSHDRGLESAKQQKNFTVLVTEDGSKQALIYQSNGVGLFKTYNTDTKTFDNAYETIEVTGKKFEVIQLITE